MNSTFALSLSFDMCRTFFTRTPPNLLLLFNSHTSCVSNLNSYSLFRLSVLLSVEIVKNSDPQDSYGLQRLHYFNWKGDLNSWNDNRCACRRISWMNLLRFEVALIKKVAKIAGDLYCVNMIWKKIDVIIEQQNPTNEAGFWCTKPVGSSPSLFAICFKPRDEPRNRHKACPHLLSHFEIAK